MHSLAGFTEFQQILLLQMDGEPVKKVKKAKKQAKVPPSDEHTTVMKEKKEKRSKAAPETAPG